MASYRQRIFSEMAMVDFDIKSLPPHIALIVKKSLLNKADYNTLRQFLYRSSKGFDPLLFVEKIAQKYGRLVAQKIWTNKDTEKVKQQSATVSQKNNAHELRSPEELRKFLYNIELTDMPGVIVKPNQQSDLNKYGKKFVKQMCYILCRQGDDPTPFMLRLENFFEKPLLAALLNDRLLKSFEKALQTYQNEQSGVTDVGGKSTEDDQEIKMLKRVSHNLTYKDIPSLRLIDEKYHLTEVSVMWLRDKIRRIFKKDLPVNSFLLKLGDMFGSALKLVFSEIFRHEITNILLPEYKCKEQHHLDSWMNESNYKTLEEPPPLYSLHTEFDDTGFCVATNVNYEPEYVGFTSDWPYDEYSPECFNFHNTRALMPAAINRQNFGPRFPPPPAGTMYMKELFGRPCGATYKQRIMMSTTVRHRMRDQQRFMPYGVNRFEKQSLVHNLESPQAADAHGSVVRRQPLLSSNVDPSSVMNGSGFDADFVPSQFQFIDRRWMQPSVDGPPQAIGNKRFRQIDVSPSSTVNATSSFFAEAPTRFTLAYPYSEAFDRAGLTRSQLAYRAPLRQPLSFPTSRYEFSATTFPPRLTTFRQPSHPPRRVYRGSGFC